MFSGIEVAGNRPDGIAPDKSAPAEQVGGSAGKRASGNSLRVPEGKPGVGVANRSTVGSSAPALQSAEPAHAGNPETIEILYGPHKGVYRVYPLCRWLPLLQGQQHEDLRRSIEERGQMDPVIIDGEWLYDGRHRVLVANELGIPPRVVEFSSLDTNLSPAEWIIAKNKDRRHLTDDQRLAYAALSSAWLKEHEGGRSPASPTAEGGKPVESSTAVAAADGQKEFRQESAENQPHRKRGRPPGRRSEARALAAAMHESRYKAEEIIRLGKLAPDLLEAVAHGGLTLKKASRELDERQQANTAQAEGDIPRRTAEPKATPLETCVEQAVKLLRGLAAKKHLSDPQWEAFVRATVRAVMGDLTTSAQLPPHKRGENLKVVSFRLPKSHFKLLADAYKGQPMVCVNSEHHFARKIVRDYLAGRLVYLGERDRVGDLDL